MTFGPTDSQAAFLSNYEVFPTDNDNHLQIKLSSLHSDIANCINIREIGLYQDDQELLTGQQFSIPGNNQKKNFAFRKIFYFGAIASGATLSTNHNITGFTQFTNIYGTIITDAVDYRPIPYVSVAVITDQVAVRITATQYVIANGATAPAITSGILVLEYLKS
jgi:hypothetical protein